MPSKLLTGGENVAEVGGNVGRRADNPSDDLRRLIAGCHWLEPFTGPKSFQMDGPRYVDSGFPIFPALLLRCSSLLRILFGGGPFRRNHGRSRLQLNVNGIGLQLATRTFRLHWHGHRLVTLHRHCDNKVAARWHGESARRLTRRPF